MSDTDLELLQEYTRTKSEDIFTALVNRHLNLVYSAAFRQVRSLQLAEEVAQSVFTDLARNAAKLNNATGGALVLTAWLYQVTRRTAIDVVRREARRQLREQIATEMNTLNATTADWTHIEPLLDEAMSALDETDRAAVLLRFFENKSLREVGVTLGTSDDAAQKRVSRAVERLREFFAKRGVTVGAGGLAVVISANAVQAAPLGLAVAISTAAVLAGTVTTSTLTAQAVATTMNWINIKSITAIIAAALAAGSGTYFVQQREASRLQDDNQTLVAEEAKLTGERDAAMSEAAAISNQLQVLKSNSQELLRLRGEIGSLRQQTQELEKLRRQNSELQKSLAQAAQTSPNAKEVEASPERQAAIAKVSDAKLLVLGLIMYASDHQDQLPTDLNQSSNYWANADVLLTRTNQFDFVIHGSLSQSNVPNPSATIAVREREPSFLNGKWVKAYGFADGHSELKSEPPEGFETWEKERILQSPAGP